MASPLDSPAQASLALLKDGTPLVATLDPAGRDFELRCPIVAGGPLSLEVTALAGSYLGDAAVFRVEVTDDPLVPIPRSHATSAISEGVTAFRPMTSARTLAIAGQTRGVISPEGRVIHYSFMAHQNEQFRFVAKAGSIGSPLAPVVRVLAPDRTVLAESLPGADAELVWIAPSDGEHLLAVTDAEGRGRTTYAFGSKSRPRAHFSAVLEDRLRPRPGGSCVCDVRVLRVSSTLSERFRDRSGGRRYGGLRAHYRGPIGFVWSCPPPPRPSRQQPVPDHDDDDWRAPLDRVRPVLPEPRTDGSACGADYRLG